MFDERKFDSGQIKTNDPFYKHKFDLFGNKSIRSDSKIIFKKKKKQSNLQIFL